MSASVGEDAPTEDTIPGIQWNPDSDANQEPEANLLSVYLYVCTYCEQFDPCSGGCQGRFLRCNVIQRTPMCSGEQRDFYLVRRT